MNTFLERSLITMDRQKKPHHHNLVGNAEETREDWLGSRGQQLKFQRDISGAGSFP